MTVLSQALKEWLAYFGQSRTEGVVDTYLDSVRIYQSRRNSPRNPLMYNMGIIIVGQGHKVLYLGDRRIQYDADNYLVLGAPLPLECEAWASEEEPFISLMIDIDLRLIHELVQTSGMHAWQGNVVDASSHLINATRLGESLEEASLRLLHCLRDPVEARIFGPDRVKEVLYRTLLGPSGDILSGLVQQDSHYGRVVQALSHIHSHYQDNLTVEKLAEASGMSVSLFHRSFKKITYHSPLQYIKKVRLNRARELILLDGTKANVAAHKVGYESPSQFSREFKRYFNQTPKELRLNG